MIVPVGWDAGHGTCVVGALRVEYGHVPGEHVWIAKLEVDASRYVTCIELKEVASASIDERLGIAELVVEGGRVIFSILPEGGASLDPVEVSTNRVQTIRRRVTGGSTTVGVAFGADAFYARAALFPFLSGARSRAGLQAARWAQSSGASSSS